MNDYFARQRLLLLPEVGRMIPNLKILFVGVGAVGNEGAKDLVLQGLRYITLVDFDFVEDSNLSRTVLFRKEDIGKSKALAAAARLLEMALADNPHIVGLHGNIMTDFGKGLFLDHDIVISCVDTLECRAFISDWCVRTNTPFFELGAEGFNVNIAFYAPADGYQQVSDGKVIDKLPSSDGLFPKPLHPLTVCLREEIGQGDFDGQRNSCFGFKVKDETLAKIPTIQSSSALAASLLSVELIKYLSGMDTIRNKVLYYYGLRHETLCCSYTPSKDCTIHQEHIPICTLEVMSEDTMGDILSKIRRRWGGEPHMQVPPFVSSGHCAGCGKEIQVNKRASDIYDEERWCDECRARYEDFAQHQDYACQWDRTPAEFTMFTEQRFLQMRPQDIGVPQDDIMKVSIAKDDCIEQLLVRLKLALG